jgi:hypothetical protein
MPLPKTAKGIASRITKIRAYLSAQKRQFGAIDDSGGLRYELFYLYFLLGDNRRSGEMFRWFVKEFPDDAGTPGQFLCWSLMLHSMGKPAEQKLIRTMLTNIYLLPELMGEPMARQDMWHGSNYAEPGMIAYVPESVIKAIGIEDRAWIAGQLCSDHFQAVLYRYIAICNELLTAPVGTRRSKLVTEMYQLMGVGLEGS